MISNRNKNSIKHLTQAFRALRI